MQTGRYIDPNNFPRWILFASGILFLLWMSFWSFLTRRHGASRPFYFFFMSAMGIPLFWFAPFIGNLFGWFDSTTFSTIGFILGFQGTYYDNAMLEFGGHFLWIMIGLLAVSWTADFLIHRNDPSRRDPLVFFAPIVFITPLIGAQTHNLDPRYYYTCVTILFFLTVLRTFRLPKAAIFRPLKIFLALCMAGSLFVSAAVMFNERSRAEALNKVIDYLTRYAYAPFNEQQPLSEFIDKFCAVAGVTPEYDRPVLMLINDSGGWVPDESELYLMCVDKGLKVHIVRPWMLYDLPESAPPLETLSKTYPLFLLGLDAQKDAVWDPQSYRVTNELLYHVKKGDLSTFGLRALGEFAMEKPGTKYLVLASSLEPKHSVLDRP